MVVVVAVVAANFRDHLIAAPLKLRLVRGRQLLEGISAII